ncbi:MAG: hypothetical protein V4657_12480 [Pseudomonadota bacterium]
MVDLKNYANAREALRASVSPVENYIETAEAIICELRLELKQQKEYIESMRPHWAQGYSDDSMAAQASTGALAEVWDMLGVKNQTDCMARLRERFEADA